MTIAATGATRSASDPGARRWPALLVMLAAAFMDLLDATVVNVALPAIRSDLHASYAAAQWITAGYTVAFGLGLILGGRMGDRYGRRRMFVAGVATFTVASALCGLAPSSAVLIVARLVQGAASSLMVPQIMATVFAVFPPRERGGASGAYGAVSGIAAVAGPVLGGTLVQYDVLGMGWRAVFFVNLPIGVLALVASLVLVPETRSDHPLKTDLPGVLLVTASLVLVLYPLVQGREQGWPGWMFVAMAASPIVLALYALHARARERRDASAFVPLRLFGQPGFTPGLLVLFLFDAAMIGFTLALSLTLQIGLGASPLRTGLLFVPWAVGAGVAAAMTDGLIARLGRHALSLGAVVMAAGIVWVITVIGPGSGWTTLAPPMLVAGLGLGLLIGPAFTVASAGVRTRDAGAASGTLSAALQLGSATGVALLSVLFFNVLVGAAGNAIDAQTDRLRAELTGLGVPAPARQLIVEGMRPCFVDRASAQDPDAEPPSCQRAGLYGPGGDAVNRAIAGVAVDARAVAFVRSLRHFGWYAIGGLVLIALLSQALPRRMPDTGQHATS
jgi:EmrB/QacA subfamily drug resistance transporter